jgi:hypothetical protein
MDLNQVKKAYKLKRYPVDPENLGPIVTGESPMIIIGFLAILMVTSSALVATACMLSSQRSRIEEQRAWTTFKVTSHLSGAPAA